MDNSKQQTRRKQEDAALNKLLIWLGIAIGYEFIALLLKRFYVNFVREEVYVAVAMTKVFSVLQWVAPALMLLCFVWAFLNHKARKPTTLPLVGAGACALVSLTVILSYWLFDVGVGMLGLVAPVMAVLALIFFLYQKDFFCNTLLVAGGIFALWLYRRFYLLHPRAITAGFVLGWMLLGAAAALAWQLAKGKGKWSSWQVFPQKTTYLPTYCSCVLTALTMASALVFGATVAFYSIFVLVVWLFCLAVYYTVRLM
jgi:hypothetical protein